MSVDMTTQSIAVADNWVKVGNDYIGNQPSGATSGGTAALGWSAPSGLSDGNTLTITTDGTFSFGVKTQAAPTLWVFGSEVFENGVANNSESSLVDGDPAATGIWALDTYPTISTDTRHAGIDHVYTGNGANQREEIVGWPNCMLGTAEDKDSSIYNEKLFCSFKSRYSNHPYFYRATAYNSLSGTFDDGANEWDEGEAVSIDGGLTATLLYVDTANSVIHFRAPSSALNSSSLNNATMTGDVSGATCVLDTATVYTVPGATKFIRAYENTSETGIRTAFSPTGNVIGGYTGFTEDYRIQPTPILGRNQANLQAWHTIESYFDHSGATGSGRLTVAGDEVTWSGFDLTNKDPSGGMVPANIGLDLPNAPTPVYETQWFGEIYVDTTPQRVVIGDGSTWAACDPDNTELLRPTAWSASSITAVYKAGSGYLYVIDADDAPINSNGVAI